MDPITIAALVTGGIQIVSGLIQADLVRNQGEINRRIAEMNAQWAEVDAWEVEKFGFTQASRYQTVIDQTIGEQRAAMAAKNVDLSFGTAAQIQEEARLTGFLNQLDLIQEARQQAMGIRAQAANYRLGGASAIANANLQATSAIIQGLAGATETGFRWAGYKYKG